MQFYVLVLSSNTRKHTAALTASAKVHCFGSHRDYCYQTDRERISEPKLKRTFGRKAICEILPRRLVRLSQSQNDVSKQILLPNSNVGDLPRASGKSPQNYFGALINIHLSRQTTDLPLKENTSHAKPQICPCVYTSVEILPEFSTALPETSRRPPRDHQKTSSGTSKN